MSWYYPEAREVSGCICEWLMTLCTEDERSSIIDGRNLSHESPTEADLISRMLGSDLVLS